MTPDELKALRQRYGLTQEKAASLAFVGARAWQRWEAGDYDIPPHRVKLLRGALKKLKPINKEEK